MSRLHYNKVSLVVIILDNIDTKFTLMDRNEKVTKARWPPLPSQGNHNAIFVMPRFIGVAATPICINKLIVYGKQSDMA